MGYASHFVGIVRDNQVCDLFSECAKPAASEHVDGAIVEVHNEQQRLLAAEGSAEAALYHLAAKHGLDPVFPMDAANQVEGLLKTTGIDDETLVDLTSVPFVTIDGADSMDLDQAVYVEASAAGHIVHYALADASYYVASGTPLHVEALRRAASYYMPGIMVPMLPRALSEGLVSLNANVDRRSVVFSMHIDGEGRCTKTAIAPSRIRSRGKLSFTAVQNFYAGGDGFGDDVDESLQHLAHVGRLRMSLAEERGVVRYRRHEVSAKLSGGGMRFTATSSVRRDVERYNEQLSLLCNIEGARYLAKHGADFVEPIYRVHPAPSEEKMRAFLEMLQALVTSQNLDPTIWLWTLDDKRPLRQFLDELPIEGSQGRIAMAIHRQAVMANLRSTFQTKAGSHHGVGAEVYARFSAPMREMVGVFLHSELLEARAGHGHANSELRQTVVQQANAAKSLQRTVSNEGNRLVLEQLFEDARKANRKLSGTLMGAEGSKAYIRLDEPPIDVKVYLKLASEPMAPSDDGTSLLRDGDVVFRLGDHVSVIVVDKHATKDRWILDLA
jgi:ribonuclease R